MQHLLFSCRVGVSTMANRDIPPLQYARVYKLVDDFPDLEFEINGAISSPTEVENHLSTKRRLKGTCLVIYLLEYCTMKIRRNKFFLFSL